MPAKHFIHQGGLADNPKVKRGMSNENSTLGHPLLEITQAKGTGKVPPNTLNNNIDGIMHAFKSISDQRRGQATLQNKQHVSRQRLSATAPSGTILPLASLTLSSFGRWDIHMATVMLICVIEADEHWSERIKQVLTFKWKSYLRGGGRYREGDEKYACS